MQTHTISCVFGRISADEALRLGLVSSVVEPDQLINHAVALAHRISCNSQPVVAKAKECVNMAEQVGLNPGLSYERCDTTTSTSAADTCVMYCCIIEAHLTNFVQ